jgi:hypothetical protein
MINLGFGFNKLQNFSKINNEKFASDNCEENKINLIRYCGNCSLIRLQNLHAIYSLSIKKFLTNDGLRSFLLASCSHVLKELYRFLG